MPPRFLQNNNIWPPPPSSDETPEQKKAREEKEKEAKQVSDAIDKALKAEKEERKSKVNQQKSAGPKVVLLGQAESGKSTILKNFRIHFSPKTFEEELPTWRAVIHLNLVHSINFIITTIEDYISEIQYRRVHPSQSSSQSQSPPHTSHSHQSHHDFNFNDDLDGETISPDMARLVKRLSVLRPTEKAIAESTAITGIANSNASLTRTSSNEERGGAVSPKHTSSSSRPGTSSASTTSTPTTSSSESRLGHGHGQYDNDIHKRVIQACAKDMNDLWKHPQVQKILAEKGIQLRHRAGFFLDDILRVSDGNYVPTSDDVLRVRLPTLGAEEYRIPMETGSGSGEEWTIYDVGGNHTLRAAWAPYFADANAIIFLVPACSFAEWDEEDRTLNRLVDNINLFKSLCRNPLLDNVNFILFLNKMDILKELLDSGVQFRKYVKGYNGGKDGSRGNDVGSVSKYLFDLFNQIHSEESSEVAKRQRKVHLHRTIGIDRVKTAQVLMKIREVLIIKKLQDTMIS